MEYPTWQNGKIATLHHRRMEAIETVNTKRNVSSRTSTMQVQVLPSGLIKGEKV